MRVIALVISLAAVVNASACKSRSSVTISTSSSTSSIPTTSSTPTTSSSTTSSAPPASTTCYAAVPGFPQGRTTTVCYDTSYSRTADQGQVDSSSQLLARCEQLCTADANCRALAAETHYAADSNFASGVCFFYDHADISPRACSDGSGRALDAVYKASGSACSTSTSAASTTLTTSTSQAPTTMSTTTSSTTTSSSTSTSAAPLPTDCSKISSPYTASNGKKFDTSCGQVIYYNEGTDNLIAAHSAYDFRTCLDLCSQTGGCNAFAWADANADPDSANGCYLYTDTSGGSGSDGNYDSGVLVKGS